MKPVALKYNGSNLYAYDTNTGDLIKEVTPFDTFLYQDELGSIEYNHHSPTHWKFVSFNGAKVRKTITQNITMQLVV